MEHLLVFGLLGMNLCALAEANQPAHHHPCGVRATKFEGWAAEEISNEWVTLTIVPELGGRLMQVTFAGHPYLFVNPKYKGRYFPPTEAKGKWFNYGGDKLWPLPEGTEDEHHWPGPVSDELDDGNYELKVISQGATCAVHLEGPPDVRTGLQYSREISIGTNSPEISFQSVMKNAATHPISWSMQTVTQYDTSDAKDPSQYNRNFWALAPLNPKSAYFSGYQVRAGLADDPSFASKDNLFSVHWLYLENEVWLDSTAGWLLVNDASSQHAMVERFHYESGKEYPGKASVIFYKNGAALELDKAGKPAVRSADLESAPYYMEAEINSPMVQLRPGERYAMETTWFPARLNGRVTDVASAGVIVVPVTASRTSEGVLISGSLGVFFPGRLVADFFDAQGVEIKRAELQSVFPQTAVQIWQDIKLPVTPQSVSVHLVDDQGNDRGSLGEIAVYTAKKEF